MVLYRYPSAARDRQEPRHERAPAGSMRLLVLAAALPRIVAFATLPDERMSYSSTGCPPGLLACEEGILGRDGSGKGIAPAMVVSDGEDECEVVWPTTHSALQ